MDPVLEAFLATFIGGEVEVVQTSGEVFRGEVREIKSVQARRGGQYRLQIKLAWNAMNITLHPQAVVCPTGTWVECKTLDYKYAIARPQDVRVLSNGRLRIVSTGTRALVTLYPKDGLKLDRHTVGWLHDGPYARWIATQ